MSSNNDRTTRFTIRIKETEKQEIEEYIEKNGIQQNELVRRAVVAYVRLREGKGKDVHRLFQQVGSIDQSDLRTADVKS